jgi:hypothetical protein
MDRISSFEFFRIFDRVSDTVDLSGKFTVAEIERELAKVRDYCARKYQEAESTRERARFKTDMVSFNNLILYGFADRTIREALKNPNGIIAMTLRFGKAWARRRILAQRRTQTRY